MIDTPEIPLPYRRLLWWQCDCRRRFWTWPGYRGHYALVHVLSLAENYRWSDSKEESSDE